jgi:hypothetical protein
MTRASGSPAERTQSPRRRRVLIESVAATVLAYILSAAFEAALIGSLGPTEWELAWVSDVALAAAFGTAVYLWRHLLTTRRELEARERSRPPTPVIHLRLSQEARACFGCAGVAHPRDSFRRRRSNTRRSSYTQAACVSW